MLEQKIDMWRAQGDVHCVTTNGFIKNDGRAVMGAGNAKQAVQIYSGIDITLGHEIKKNGNVVNKIWDVPLIYAFPVKPEYVISNGANVLGRLSNESNKGKRLPGWMAKSDISLILKSARHLVMIADAEGWKRVIVPRPGCGNGELDWETQVRGPLRRIFDDRFLVVYI